MELLFPLPTSPHSLGSGNREKHAALLPFPRALSETSKELRWTGLIGDCGFTLWP